jgi:hypothetical protein
VVVVVEFVLRFPTKFLRNCSKRHRLDVADDDVVEVVVVVVVVFVFVLADNELPSDVFIIVKSSGTFF